MDLLLLGKEPVSEDQPAGSDIKYEPEFEALQSEIDKLASPTAAGAVDWNKVVTLSSEILAEKSKDLLAASYLAVALIYTRQIDGFSIGLTIYSDLLEQFWDTLFPAKARMRGRIRALEWWLEKSETALKPLKGTPPAREEIDLLRERSEKIEQFLRQNVEDAPSLFPVYQFLDSFSALPEEPPEETVSPQAPSESKVEEAPAVRTEVKETEVTGAISTSKEADQALDQVVRKMSEVATYYWQQDLSNPMLYRLDRLSAWLMLETLPPSTEGQTRIPPPTAQVNNMLDEMKTKGEYESLLKAAEEKLTQFIFWIDLNRFVAESLAQLGDKYERAYRAVCEETAHFVQRLPGVEALAFSDGTPFADQETRQWLKVIASSPLSEASDSISVAEPAASDEEDMIQQELKEAQALIKKKKLAEALDRLQQRIHQSFSRKENLLWRLALSQLLINNKKPQLALPHLEQIIRDIDMYKLEEYDPFFALKCLKLVWQGFQRQSNRASADRADEMLQRIARIDMAEMIRLGKG